MKKIEILDVLYPINELIGASNKSNVICPNPNHVDRKPSSHIYNNRIWCFTCKRFFYVRDIIKYKKLDIDTLYDELLIQYKDEDLLELYNEKKIEKKEEKKITKRKKNENFIDFTMRWFNNIDKN